MTLPLKYPRLWLVIGWLAVALALFVSLKPNGVLAAGVLNDKIQHGAGYAALTLWFAGIYPRSRYWFIAFALAFMGLGVEFLQGWMQLGRERDFHDVIANLTGIGVGLALAVSGFGGWVQRVEVWIGRS